MIIVCKSFIDTLLKYLIFAEVNMLQLRRQDRIYAGAEVNHCQCFAKIYVVHFIYWDVKQENSIGDHFFTSQDSILYGPNQGR